jgi:hypothetical protein
MSELKPHPSPEWVEGAPLSTYLRLAVADARAALATGHYVLDGYVWHELQSKPDSLEGQRLCGICLGGATLARRTGFDHWHYRLPDELPKGWGRMVIFALDKIRRGSLGAALEILEMPTPKELPSLPSLRSVRHNSIGRPGMASLDTYEQLAKELADAGL